jgi:hypothetical protein
MRRVDKTPPGDGLGAEYEATRASVAAYLSASWMNRARDCKEPYDMCEAMLPVVDAMLEFLVRSGFGSGDETAWCAFIEECLRENINEAWEWTGS